MQRPGRQVAMAALESLSLDAFRQELQSCLAHFYDYAFLQNNSLVRQLAPQENAVARAQQFRDWVARAIEAMRPAANIPFHARGARAFNVLSLRYVDQLDIDDILAQLALSRRQYFREHARALDTLASLLWEQWTGQKPEPPAGDPISLESEIASLGQSSEDTQVEVGELLAGAARAVGKLAEQRGVAVIFEAREGTAVIDADRTLLRQAILSLLSALIARAAPQDTLTLSFLTSDSALTVHFAASGAALHDPAALDALMTDQATLPAIIKTLDATLTFDASVQPPVLNLVIPRPEQTILVIDDNPDVVSLFRRYVAGQPYRVISAPDGEQGIRLACKGHVDVIILDIMLPRQDGFEILQTLKTNALTRRIPVLVCSVLSERDLALSLGADGFLRKPPGQDDLLIALAELAQRAERRA